MSDKSLADVVEALIGAFLANSGQNNTLKVDNRFPLPFFYILLLFSSMLNRFIYPSINLSPYESLYVYVYITHIIIFMYVLSIIASLPFLLSRSLRPFLYLRSVLFSVFSLTIYMTIINELSPILWTHKISIR